MRMLLTSLAAVFVLTLGSHARSETDPAKGDDFVPITEIIAAVSKKTGKKFIVDPRVRANVTVIGQATSNISYPELLTILQVHGFTAVEGGGYVQVVPDAAARQLASTTASGRDKFADAEFISRVIEVKSVPAVMLVPILRPLLPQNAHLAALACRNTLLMVDTYANVKRIEGIIQELDKGAPYQPEKCVPPPPKPPTPPKDAAS